MTTTDINQTLLQLHAEATLTQDPVAHIDNLLSIIKIEKEVLSTTSWETSLKLRTALTLSIPSPSDWDNIVITDDLANKMLQTSYLLHSPLMDFFSPHRRQEFEADILWILRRAVRRDRKDIPPSSTLYFSLLKRVLESPAQLEILILNDDYVETSLILWGLLYDPSFLSYLNASNINEDFRDGFAKPILERYLNDKNIDRSLFWGLLESAPELPLGDILNLLSE